MSLSSKVALLSYLARLNPKLWEIVHPHVPKVSVCTREVMAAMIVKAIAPEITDAKISRELQAAGKRLFTSGSKAMNYDDDDWCPTGPHPVLGPDPVPWLSVYSGFEEFFLNPQPLPPKEQTYFGALLSVLSEAVSSKEAATVLQKSANALLNTTVAKGQK
jgi:hypothetical protein